MDDSTIPTSDLGPTASDRIGSQVRDFYQEMPFNFYESAEATLEHIRSNPVEFSYPDLHALLRSGKVKSVIEFGCGAGWLSNSLALHYGVEVTGVDFTARALQRAREVAQLLGIEGKVRFEESDIFDFADAEAVDLVVSVGVLHHTRDAEAAFHHIQQFAKPGAFVYVGLYHHFGRREFLRIFRELVETEGEAVAFEHYSALDGTRRGDATHMMSWFRDQVLHPHETQHTLKQVAAWCAADGLEITSTSINRFEQLSMNADLGELFEIEKEYEALSHQANVVEKRYFPGFFVALAKRVN